MSHNILTLNNNSFDVNSDRTESATNISWAYIETWGAPTYPRNFTNGHNYLIYRGNVYPSTLPSWITLTDNSSYANWVDTITFTEDGVYRIAGNSQLTYASASAGNTFRLSIEDVTGGSNTEISSYSYNKRNTVDRPFNSHLTTIVERSGSDVSIRVRIESVSNISRTSTAPYRRTSFFIERLQ